MAARDEPTPTFVIEIITSWVTLGAMAGALIAGTLTEHDGRRMSILLAAAVFVVGALLEALAPNTFVLVIGSVGVGVGVGVGVASVAAPLYGAENEQSRDPCRSTSFGSATPRPAVAIVHVIG